MRRWFALAGLVGLFVITSGCGATDDAGLGARGGSSAGGTSGSAGSDAGSGGAAGSAGSSSGGVAGAAQGGSAGSSTGGSAGSSTGGAAGGPFTIGGIVSGLSGSGLVLRNNGADDLPIAQNGVFVFTTPLASGQSYSVSVAAEPTSPDQSCTVAGGSGAVAAANVTDVVVACKLLDSDGDGVPDVADPFPNDATKPKLALPKRVYPHTASKLFTMDVDTYAIAEIGNFNGSTFSGSMTDLAVDQYGVIYAVTFNNLYTCDATTATCYHLASLPQMFNGLTLVPPGVHHPYLDTLIGIANSGAWYKVTLSGSGSAQLQQIGSYGAGYTSSGDAFAIEGVGTFASVDKVGQSSDLIVSVDPKTGAVLKEIGPVTGYSALYGLAGWQGVVFGFNETGAVLKIDITTGAASLIVQTANPWWGAGVATRLATN
jgi:hypothetical protein